MTLHEGFMLEALKEAQKALELNEVPIGAIVVYRGEIIGRGYNLRESKKNALAHAEIIAINEACQKLGGWRLVDCDLYVTLEPCIMCAGAIYQSRIVNVYYGAKDLKAGAFGSLYDLSKDSRLNHIVSCTCGILEDECSMMISNFFKMLRDQKRR